MDIKEDLWPKKDELEIDKVRISDVQSPASDELAEAEQEKVSGGGGYYTDGGFDGT